jgi:hypothetical protein
MSGRSKAAQLSDALDKLEAKYGKLVPSTDPVEAGVLTLLAMHAPKFSNAASRDRLREAFIDWNEMRVSDPWDVASALEADGDPESRAFGRAAVRFLESINAVLHRTTFETAKTDLTTDMAPVIEKMRGAPPPVKAVVLAALDTTGGWRPGAEMAKLLQRLGVVGKTASASKAGKEAQEAAAEEDRLRAHYLLTRYALREKEEDDPLKGVGAGGRAAKAPAEKKPKSGKPAKAKASASKE